MSNKMRWRYGDTNPILAPVDSATVIEIGDLLFLSSGKAIPAKDITEGENAAATQTTFTSGFVGIAMQCSNSSDTTPIRVATTGYFDLSATSATFLLGDKVGIAADNDGTVLSNQTVAKVSSVNYMIGRVAKTESVATTSVLVKITSVIMNGSFT